jgi:hypothetical protein
MFFNLLNSSVKSVIIVPGSVGQSLIPKLYSGLREAPNIYAIIIFCQAVEHHRQWAANYPKIYLVT